MHIEILPRVSASVAMRPSVMIGVVIGGMFVLFARHENSIAQNENFVRNIFK